MASNVEWIKLMVVARNSKSMKQIKALPQGKEVALLFYELIQLAGEINQNGFLLYDQEEAYTDEMLAAELNEKTEFIKYAMQAFEKLKMVEKPDGIYKITNWEKYQNIEALEEMRQKQLEQNRKRQARFREKQKNKLIEGNADNVTVTLRNANPSYSYSISNSISNYKEDNNIPSIDIINNNDTNILKSNINNTDPFQKYGEYGWVKLKPSQYEKLKIDFPNVDIDNQIKSLDEYVQSNGNKNKYKDFNLVIRKSIRDGWFTKSQQQGKQTKPSKAVPEWFDKHMEEAKKREEEERKKQESEENLRSLEELEEFFKTKKKAR